MRMRLSTASRSGPSHGARVWVTLVVTVALVTGSWRGTAQAVCATLCQNQNPCTISADNIIDAGCYLHWEDKDVTIASGGVVRHDSPGSTMTIAARNLTVQGTLRAQGSSMDVYTSEKFATKISGSSAALVDASSGGTIYITADGACELDGKNITASGTSGGGSVDIRCASVVGSTPIHSDGTANGADGWMVHVEATAGPLVLSGAITANGYSGSTTSADGGAVELLATGPMYLGTGTVEAKGYKGGDGGAITLHADGPATIESPLSINCTSDTVNDYYCWVIYGILVEASSVTTNTAWNASAGADGMAGAIYVTADNGIAMEGASMTASVTQADVDGGPGGSIALYAGGDIVVNGDLLATGTKNQDGGSVTVSSGGGNVTIGAASRLATEVSLTGEGWEGDIDLCGWDVVLAGDLDARKTSPVWGTNYLRYRNSLIVSADASVQAGSDNRYMCRCVDTDGTPGCDSPLRCITDPVSRGTFTPAVVTSPVSTVYCN